MTYWNQFDNHEVIQPDEVDVLIIRLHELESTEHDAALMKAHLQEAERIRERLIYGNWGLLLTVLKKFTKTCSEEDREALKSCGILALGKAINDYDPSKGMWSSFAYKAIYRDMRKYVGEKNRTIPIPPKFAETKAKLVCIARQLAIELGHQPRLSEVAKICNLTIAQADTILKFGNRTFSADQEVKDKDGADYWNFMSSPQDMPHNQMHGENTLEKINECLLMLPPKEYLTLSLLYGLGDGYAAGIQSIINEFQKSSPGLTKLKEDLLGDVNGESDVYLKIKGFFETNIAVADKADSDLCKDIGI